MIDIWQIYVTLFQKQINLFILQFLSRDIIKVTSGLTLLQNI